MVPMQFAQDGQIVLNIAPRAVMQFHMDNEAISFSARFGGVSQQVYIPMAAVLAIHARENGVGTMSRPSRVTISGWSRPKRRWSLSRNRRVQAVVRP